MRLPTLQDSNGERSTTLFLVALPWLAMIGAFCWATWQGKDPNYSDFGGGTALLIFSWVGRKAVSTMETKAGSFRLNPPDPAA